MKRNYFISGALLMLMILFTFGCGGGDDSGVSASTVPTSCADSTICNPPTYITDNFRFLFEVGDFFSEKGATENLQTKKILVCQDGEAYQAMKTWNNFSIKKGDLYTITINGSSLPEGKEVTLKIKNAAENVTYAEKTFIFRGKQVINLSINSNDNRARLHLMLGKKSGEYSFFDDILVERKRLKSDKLPRTVSIDLLACKFIVEKDLGSTRSSNGEITAKTGRERWSTMVKCDNVSIEEGKIFKFITSGHSFPTNNVVYKFESSSSQDDLGEQTIELAGEKLVFEIVPTGKDAAGKLAIFFPKAGIYHPGLITIEITD